MKNIIEKVAAGLRRMKEEPDALLYIMNPNFMWDEDHIVGIPVLHTDVPFEIFYNEGLLERCYFLPIWENDRSDKQFLTRKFFQGWDDMDTKNS